MIAPQPTCGAEFGTASTATPGTACGSVVIRRVDDLRAHPSYLRHRLAVPMSALAALAAIGDLAFRDPLVVTNDGTLIDGYARFELARQQGRPTLPCIEYELTEPQSLQYLLDRHRRSSELNDFIRILLALDLEPWLAEKARSNQQAGGHHKGSSNLTEAQRIDVRSEIAKVAGVSVGNVTKVKQLIANLHPELLCALRSGEIRIHRAWLWSKETPENQHRQLLDYRSARGIKKTIRGLISKHLEKAAPDLSTLVAELSQLEPIVLDSINVVAIKASGMAVFVTEDLMEHLQSQRKLVLGCANH